MKDQSLHLIFILDRSGSMTGLESDVIGGFNSVISKQRQQHNSIFVTTVLFDDQYSIIHHHLSLDDVELTQQDYYARGMTALLDAIGKTIQQTTNTSYTSCDIACKSKTLVVIITDGLENASKEYQYPQIKSMIERQTHNHAWEFIFMGANMDAIAAASNLGIRPSRAVNFHADHDGLNAAYAAASQAVDCIRATPSFGDEWRTSADEDFTMRNT